MKLNSEWLMQLPQELQAEWTQEMLDFNGNEINDFINRESESFWDFMAESFTWEYSQQGHEYWENIADRY